MCLLCVPEKVLQQQSVSGEGEGRGGADYAYGTLTACVSMCSAESDLGIRCMGVMSRDSSFKL